VTQPVYLPDTHTLYWHISRSSRLSSTARNITDDAASGKAVLVASPIVLAELYWVLRKQGAASAFADLARRLLTSPAYRYESLTAEDILALPSWEEIPEMHDRFLAIQASRLGAVLVTRDASLLASSRVRTIW
jgi:predicted nucleic acid-binding protein